MTLAFVFAFTGAAQATTLGITTQPSGSGPNGCGAGSVINQVTSDPSTPYSVPSSGTITQWQTVASLDTPGAPVTLVVLKPVGSSFTVVGVDARTIPNPAPPVATYTLATPITVSGGETFGLYTNSGGLVVCFWNGGATPLGNTLAALTAASPPATSQTLNRAIGDSPGGYTMNLSANFVPTPPAHKKKKCKKKKKRSAESAKKKKCKKKKKR